MCLYWRKLAWEAIGKVRIKASQVTSRVRYYATLNNIAVPNAQRCNNNQIKSNQLKRIEIKVTLSLMASVGILILLRSHPIK